MWLSYVLTAHIAARQRGASAFHIKYRVIQSVNSTTARLVTVDKLCIEHEYVPSFGLRVFYFTRSNRALGLSQAWP